MHYLVLIAVTNGIGNKIGNIEYIVFTNKLTYINIYIYYIKVYYEILQKSYGPRIGYIV